MVEAHRLAPYGHDAGGVGGAGLFKRGASALIFEIVEQVQPAGIGLARRDLFDGNRPAMLAVLGDGGHRDPCK